MQRDVSFTGHSKAVTEEPDATADAVTEEPVPSGNATAEVVTEEPVSAGNATADTVAEKPVPAGNATAEAVTEEPVPAGNATAEAVTEEFAGDEEPVPATKDSIAQAVSACDAAAVSRRVAYKAMAEAKVMVRVKTKAKEQADTDINLWQEKLTAVRAVCNDYDCEDVRAEVDVRVEWRKMLEIEVQRVSPLNCAVYSETTGVIMLCLHDVCKQVILLRQQ